MAGKVSNLVIYGKWQGFILSGRKRCLKKKGTHAAKSVQSAVKFGQCDGKCEVAWKINIFNKSFGIVRVIR